SSTSIASSMVARGGAAAASIGHAARIVRARKRREGFIRVLRWLSWRKPCETCEAKPIPTGELLARGLVRSIAAACETHNPGSFGEAGKLRKRGRGRRHRRRKTGEPGP